MTDVPVEDGKAESVAELDANRIIESQLTSRLQAVENCMDADLITFIGPMHSPADELIKAFIEGLPQGHDTLVCVLETNGGLSSVVERMALIFRHHYDRVEFLVPSHAMSAGTILVMSGDAIHMDYSSMLGPIDPQIQAKTGSWVPALGYLEMYNRLIEKSEDGDLTTAEVAYLVQNFDPGELYRYEQEMELSIALLQEWLVKYKFQNWTETASRGKKVTKRMKSSRAKQIARELNKTDRWHSHSRGIPMSVLTQDLKLQVDDFGSDKKLSAAIREYYHLLKDYSMKRNQLMFVVHRRGEYFGL